MCPRLGQGTTAGKWSPKSTNWGLPFGSRSQMESPDPFVIPAKAQRTGGISSSANLSWKCFLPINRKDGTTDTHAKV